MIREALDFDLPQLVGMARKFHAESPYGDMGIEFDPISMDRSFWTLMRSPHGIVLVSGRGLNDHRGFVAGVLYPLYFNAQQVIGQELMWWADPEHRSGTGRDLLEALETEAQKRGAVGMIASSLDSLRGPAIQRYFGRLGYEPSEHSFIKRF